MDWNFTDWLIRIFFIAVIFIGIPGFILEKYGYDNERSVIIALLLMFIGLVILTPFIFSETGTQYTRVPARR